MKKILALSLTLVFAASLIAGCGCSKNETAKTPNAQTEQGTPSNDNSAESETTTQDGQATKAPAENEAKKPAANLPAVSENKEVVEKDAAPKIVIMETPADNVDSLTYHLEDCRKLSGKKIQEISWEIVQMIGFWQCPECNPPRYEGYSNAE